MWWWLYYLLCLARLHAATRIPAFDSVPGSLRGGFVECGSPCLHARLCIESAVRDRDLGLPLCSFCSLLVAVGFLIRRGGKRWLTATGYGMLWWASKSILSVVNIFLSICFSLNFSWISLLDEISDIARISSRLGFTFFLIWIGFVYFISASWFHLHWMIISYTFRSI